MAGRKGCRDWRWVGDVNLALDVEHWLAVRVRTSGGTNEQAQNV